MRPSSQFLSAGICVVLAGYGGVKAAPQAQDIYRFTIGGTGATKVAIAPCSATTEPLRTSCGVVREVLKTDLDFEGFQLTPESLMRSLPLVDPKAPNYLDWKS
ncbi:MAG TPA: hypothetical protein PKU70_13755, partial [Vicinamibacteria bacterium]|nr:hypothetical protein [Vicinamibacteria bacterium]